MSQIQDMRAHYDKDSLSEEQCPDHPMDLFQLWFQEAVASLGPTREPNAVCLSTCTVDGIPSSRMVLLKKFDSEGFVFYTNYESRKALELAQNPHAAMVFWWDQRSVRIQGKVAKIPSEESDAYFAARPRGSQIGAWASPQSQFIQHKKDLQEMETATIKRFEQQETIPRPPHWGGYRLTPCSIEFWQGRPSRLHDRIYYSFKNAWTRIRLAP